jgi:hypothetical protein
MAARRKRGLAVESATDAVGSGHPDVMHVRGLRLALVGTLTACNGSVRDIELSHPVADGGIEASPPVDAAMVIGTPCLPSEESILTFDGFSDTEVTFSTTTPSGGPMCIVDRFRGLVTCPYGQIATGQPPADGSPCLSIDGQPVVGMVEPQCVDRPASQVVVWSCRCANAQGRTDDGVAYCTCPASTVCSQLITPIGPSEDEVSGAYCLPPAALTDGGPTCAVACDPISAPCP